ncbi:MAG: hypothetical protein AB8B50_07910 [Pirellulaceae bacterium]
MDTTIRYLAFAVFLIVVLAVALALSGGIPIGRGPGRGPILELRPIMLGFEFGLGQ